MNQAIRIYLAYQRIADGRVQIRRWSPDRVSPTGRAGQKFLGFEKQSSQATAWLAAHGEPTWPECLAVALPVEPYYVSNNGDAFKAWEPTKSPAVYEQWCGRAKRVVTGNDPLEMGGTFMNETAVVDESALAGVMKTLKANKGEK